VNLETNSITTEVDGEINLNKCERVKARIDAYLSMNPRLTLQNVEDKTSVPYSTLRRIANLNGNPQPEAVIKIYQALGYDQELYQYMTDYHPDIASVMTLKSSHNQEYEYISDSDRKYFSSEDYFLILCLAYTTNGTTENEVMLELGKRGLEKVQDLLDKKIIQKLDSGKLVGKIKDYKLSFADTKERINLAMKHYKLSESGGINNWMSFQTESINDAGLNALKILQQKHYNERKEQILNNPVYNGNIKVYSATVSSTFLTYTEQGGLQ